MKQKMEDAIKRRKAIMVIMEIILVIGCIISIWIMSIPKDKFLASTYSYSKVEKYEINGNYITRVMPQTDYETFIKIAQNTLKDTVSEDFSIKVYKDKEKTQEVTSGYITTGMIVAVNSENEEKKEEIVEQKDESANQVVSANTINANSNSEKQNVISEDEKAKNKTNENAINETNAVAQNVVDSENVDVENKVDTRSSSEDVLEDSETKDEVNKGLEYTINVVGDLTENGDMSVTELTRIVRGVVKLKNWDFKEDEKTIVDLNGDNQIDITDVECCINYIVFGEFEVIKKDVASPSIEVTGEKDSINDYYTSDVEVKVIENEPKENIEKTTISVEMNFSDTGETKVVDTNEKTFKLSRNGTYTITSQTYNKDGNKSDIVTKTIRINKEQKTEVAYKVEHYKEKLDGSYELAETDGLTGTTGLKVTAQAKEYIGFTEDKNNEQRIPEGTIAGDGSLTLRLYYTRNTYTIKFEDYNGSMLGEEKEYLYGQTIEVPENPTRPEDETYTYTFAGWDKEITEANENRVYVATYTATYREYVVTFKQDNGNEINSRNYHYGDTIIVP